jgi:hypothetical protein
MTLHSPRRQYNDANVISTQSTRLMPTSEVKLYQKRRDSQIFSTGFLATQPIQVHGLLPQQTHTHTHSAIASSSSLPSHSRAHPPCQWAEDSRSYIDVTGGPSAC